MSSSLGADTRTRSLAERLVFLSGAKPKPARPKPAPAPSTPLARLLGGRWVASGELRVLQTFVSLPLASRHGSSELAAWLAPSYESLAVVAAEEKAARLDPRKTVFLDTETTGLAGGMGTVAFLVGLAWVEGPTMRVEQWFIEDYPHEPLLLEKIVERLKRFEFLVTFNGKAYDRDILESRLALHRLPSPLGRLIHLDLLHASRRIWKDAFADCRLATLEAALLGVRRADDIPGAEIPQAYFDFLLRGDAGPLPRIFEHNRLDLLSLVALAARLNALTRAQAAVHEKVSIARILYSRREIEKALAWFEQGLGDAPLHGVHAAARKLYALCLKSAGRFQDAAAVWQELACEGRIFDALPYEELAKHFEHRARDGARALEVTEEALRRMARQRAFARLGDPDVEKRFLARRNRLARKLTARAGAVP